MKLFGHKLNQKASQGTRLRWWPTTILVIMCVVYWQLCSLPSPGGAWRVSTIWREYISLGGKTTERAWIHCRKPSLQCNSYGWFCHVAKSIWAITNQNGTLSSHPEKLHLSLLDTDKKDLKIWHIQNIWYVLKNHDCQYPLTSYLSQPNFHIFSML